MPEIKAYAPGIYARSEELVRATRELDRGQASEEALEQQRDKDLPAFLDAQREAGLDYLSDGLLNWRDIFGPFDEAASALPGSVEPLGEPFFQVGDLPRGRWVATLPSPHSLAEQTGWEIEPRAIAEGVLRPQIGWLVENGCAMVVLQETALFGRSSDLYGLSAALDALASPLPLALQLPFGDADEILGELMELDVAAIGVDLRATDVAALPRPFPKTLLAGVIDAKSSLLEKPEDLAEFGRSILEDMDEEAELHLVPNGDLRFVPERIAREKVLRLGATARLLKDQNVEEGAVT